MYANVVVDIEGMDAPGALTYSVPDAMRSDIATGTYVRVPLGSREALGYVIGLEEAYAGEFVKPIAEIVHSGPLFDSSLLNLATWIGGRYHAPLAEVLRCLVPEGLATRLRTRVSLHGIDDPEDAAQSLARRSPALAALVRALAAVGPCDIHTLRAHWQGKDLAAALARLRRRGWIREETILMPLCGRPRMALAFRCSLPPDALAASIEARRMRAPAQANALRIFEEKGRAPVLSREAAGLGISTAALRSLAREGLLAAERIPLRRDPWGEAASIATSYALTPAQQHAAERLEEAIKANQHDTILLHGVTGSGKTEIYLRAIETAMSRGLDAIMLLPEISLTAQVMEAFKGRFGDRVALLHSRLSAGERCDEWERLRTGEARVAVGPRSAIFAPCRRLGLIIMDEEHEPSYKQENSPRYHTRQAALQRARAADALLVLGSATPAVESYALAASGDYRLIEMPDRVPGRVLPSTRLIDMRSPGPVSRREIFSQALLDALADRLRRSEQAILFLNRRGFASFLLCRDCGFTPNCAHCSVSLTLHALDRSLRCHHCNYQRSAPNVCPQCRGDRILPFGIGTERVEAEARACFPSARVLRMDRDTTAQKDAHRRLYHAFRSQEADILIGTQMIAKGLDFPAVTLVGVISADGGLQIPDFRAAERTFQLLTQVAGRAGRGERTGEVLIQTYNPDHYAILAARDHDYAAFYAQEIDFRRELGYPPFGSLAYVLSSDPDAGTAETRASRAGAEIAGRARREKWEVEVLGPAPAPLVRIKRRYRWQVVVRGPRDEEVQAAIRTGLAMLSPVERSTLVVDVDPISAA